MSVELTMLVWSAALLLVLVLFQATQGVQAQGLMPMAGSRDDLPPPKPYQARVKRVVSPAARARLSRLAKARWAVAKKAGKTRLG